MSWKSILQEYALNPYPEKLPPFVRVTHTSRTIAVFDKFNKAKYHLLLLPRPTASWEAPELVSLKRVLQSDKVAAKNLLEMLREESEPVIRMIQDEMVKTTGCTWKIHRGFHAVQSLDHIHLHIISDDLVSENLKNKKHYNSFHPTLGFFLHVDEVIGWFSLPDAEFRKRASLRQDEFEDLLKQDLRSWRTGKRYGTIPNLRVHLEQEWEHETQKGRVALAKRGREESDGDEDGDEAVQPLAAKKAKSRESDTE